MSIALVLLLILALLVVWMSTVCRRTLRSCLEHSSCRQGTGRKRTAGAPRDAAAGPPPRGQVQLSGYEAGGLRGFELSPHGMLSAIYKAAYDDPSPKPTVSEDSCSSPYDADVSTARARNGRALPPLPGARVSRQADTTVLNTAPSSSCNAGANGNEGLQKGSASNGIGSGDDKADCTATNSGSAPKSKPPLETFEDWISSVFFPSNLSV